MKLNVLWWQYIYVPNFYKNCYKLSSSQSIFHFIHTYFRIANNFLFATLKIIRYFFYRTAHFSITIRFRHNAFRCIFHSQLLYFLTLSKIYHMFEHFLNPWLEPTRTLYLKCNFLFTQFDVSVDYNIIYFTTQIVFSRGFHSFFFIHSFFIIQSLGQSSTLLLITYKESMI